MLSETEVQQVKHYNIGQKYRVVIERAASTKGGLGYKVESNGDDRTRVIDDVIWLKDAIEKVTQPAIPVEVKKE